MADLDPLLAALIGKLPAGGPFPGEQRAAWLKMMGMAFDVVYGVAEDMPNFLGAAPNFVRTAARSPAPAPAAAPARAKHVGHDFYIAEGGCALNAAGVPVLIEDVPPDTIIFDYRPVPGGDFRNVGGIVWADGTTGTADIAPGCSFCGPG